MSDKKIMFGPIIHLFSIGLACVGAALNAQAMLIYLIVVKLIYAIVVSIAIDGWKKDETTLVETSETRWNINIHGIPITESRSSLFNLHCKSEQELRRKYLLMILPKAMIIFGLTVLSGINVYENHELIMLSPVYFIFVLVAIFMLIKLYQVSKVLMGLFSGEWYLHSKDFGSDTYYSAYSMTPGALEPYLSKVFD